MSSTPRFWLTAFWGFEPEHEGYYGFTLEGGRNRFLREYQDGDLVLIYGADVANTDKLDRKQVLGILEVKPTPIRDTEKISEFGLAEKERLGKIDSWTYAVPVKRAWKIEQRIGVRDLLPQTYDGTNGQSLASFGQLVTEQEAENVAALRVTEVNVFGEPPVTLKAERHTDFQTAWEVSQGPPPSFGRRTSNYSDGEAYAYVFELSGDLVSFLGLPPHEARTKRLIKVGRANNVNRRLAELNCGFPPSSKVRWKKRMVSQPYRNGLEAHDAEKALHKVFTEVGAPRGGEFFLCDERLINSAFAREAKAFRLTVS